jgi:hypothetical protein
LSGGHVKGDGVAVVDVLAVHRFWCRFRGIEDGEIDGDQSSVVLTRDIRESSGNAPVGARCVTVCVVESMATISLVPVAVAYTM